MEGARQIRIETNSVQIKLPNNFTYYQYDVFTKSDPKGRDAGPKKKMMLFHHLQNAVAPDVFNPRMIYDRQSIAFCQKQLPFSSSGNASGSFFIHLDKDQQVPPGTRGSFQIVLSPTVGEVVRRQDIEELLVAGGGPHSSATLGPRSRGERAKNVVQLLARQGPNLRYRTNNGRSYFSGVRGESRDVENTGRGIEFWRGIFLSVRPALNRLILTVDTCSTAVYHGGSLIDVCLDFLNPRQRDCRHLELTQDSPEFKKLEKFLSGVRVTVKTGNNKSSRPKIIRGLKEKGAQFGFTKADGENTTVEHHFFETYNVRLQFRNIIGVSFEKRNSERQNVVPAEFCSIEPGQICHKIPDELRAGMVKFSAMKPGDRKRRIVKEIGEYIRSEYLAESQLELDPRLISVLGKQLTAPQVMYRSGPMHPRPDGSWNVVNKQLYDVRPLTNWAVLNLCPTQVTTEKCRDFMIQMTNCCKALGMPVQPPYEIATGSPYTVDKSLNDMLRSVRNNPQFIEAQKKAPPPFIVIVLLEQDAGPTRIKVKYWGDISQGVLTQCLRFGKFNTGSNQYWNNVAIKLNARLGGTNSYAHSPFWDGVMRPLGLYMIMGADVGHPGPGIQKPSVTSIVYSWDQYAAKYAAMSGIQQPRQEIIEDFRQYVKSAISSFVQANGGKIPASIFFFRDGVSEGEYQTVSKHERDELQAAIDALWVENSVKYPKPKITFVIVTKRHHAVFFPEGNVNPKDNCPAGLVVDADVTTPVLRNFYLQSHTAIQGTSRSSHYIVLQDDNFNYDLHRLEHLCYHLCHVYAKATRSVSIPAPVYYADLVCSRLMFHLNPLAPLPSDDGASTSSGESNQFDLSIWRSAFQKLNNSLIPRMYFL